MDISPGQLDILNHFVKKCLIPAKIKQSWSGIEIHQLFTIHCSNISNLKYNAFAFFPTVNGTQGKTKSVLKYFLENVLKLRINYTTKRYWIKNQEDIDNLYNYIASIPKKPKPQPKPETED